MINEPCIDSVLTWFLRFFLVGNDVMTQFLPKSFSRISSLLAEASFIMLSSHL